MAKQKKGGKGKNKKQKKGGKGLLVLILVPILIIVLIAALIFAIIDGILGIIIDFIKGLIEFFSDPIGWFSELFRNIGNWFASWLGGDYSPPEPERAYMAVYIDDDTVDQIKESLAEAAIDEKKAGLTDSVLKKIILAYYTTYATVDTLIYIPINEEELDESGETIDAETFSKAEDVMREIDGDTIYFKGKGDDFKGEDGQLYVATEGIVKPLNADGEKMKYYDIETFMSIAAEFDESVEDQDSQSYINSFFDTFSDIYTIAEGATGSVTVIRGDTRGIGSGYSEARTLDYRELISKYAMPIELLVNMLNITACPDFIDDVGNLVESSSIEININQTKIEEDTTTVLNFTIVDNNAEESTEYDQSITMTAKNTSNDFILTLNSVKCWYCNGTFDTIKDVMPIETDPEDVTETWKSKIDQIVADYRSNSIVAVYYASCGMTSFSLETDDDGNVSYSIINKSAEESTEGTITSYTESTATHTENIQPFIDLLKTKYKDLYIKTVETAIPGDLLCNGAEMFFQLLEESTNTAEYVNVMKYILYRYSGIDYGVANFDEVFELFQTTQVGTNYTSPFGTDMTLEEFKDLVLEYNGGADYANLTDLADDFYNICQQDKYDINPCLAFGWACVETMYGRNIKDNNLFGMAKELGSNELEKYGTPQDSITAFCEWILDTSTEGTEAYNDACAVVEEFAAEDEKFGGNPHSNVYVLFVNFPYVEATEKTPEQRVQKSKTETNRRTERAKTIFGDECLKKSKSSVIEAAYEVADHFLNSGVTIHYAGNSVPEATNNGRTVCGTVQASWEDPIKYPSTKGIVCATFVSLAIWRAELIDEATINGYGFHACTGVTDMLDNSSYASDWKKITNWNDLQDGDVVYTYGHIWVYVEGGRVLDQNYCAVTSGGDDRRGELGYASGYASNFRAGYRYIGR